MKDLVDQAIAQLSDDGRRLYLGNAAWPPKLKRLLRKRASRSLRIPLRSAHRFSVTEDMQEFCKNMSENLSESQFEALVENAAPPFEAAVFENMPNEGECVLVERQRWNAMDLWHPKSAEAAVFTMQPVVRKGNENEQLQQIMISWYRAYDSPQAFIDTTMGTQRLKDEKKIARGATRNSADHPVYYVRKFFVDTRTKPQSLEVDPFGFYFCPTGFLWHKESPSGFIDWWTTQHVAMQRSFDVFNPSRMLEMDPRAPAWLSHERKVCMSSTEFLPMSVQKNVGKNRIQYIYQEWLSKKTALKILSLLSTLNFDWIVDGAEPGKTGQRVRVEPDAPFNSHSEIQINLPKEKGVELALKKFHRASPLGVRRHWVRAHNRVIRKNGVPVRVIRVSEHQRGDAKLGTVTHDYVLERDHKVKA
jgi:hypothetical protein